LPREKFFAKKYKLCQERKVLPMRNIGFAKSYKSLTKKKYRFCREIHFQEEI
jgi:hypothetical protein